MENKTSVLRVGQVVKNNREMCMLLGEDYKQSGKGRILQQKDWERFFKYKKDGHKYIILEVFEVPKPKIDKRKEGNNNNDIYGEIVQELIMDLLITNDGKLSNPIGDFLVELSMTNQNYSYYQYNHPELAELLNIDIFSVYYFFLRSKNNFRGIFERALNNLAKKQYLMWEKVMMIKFEYTHEVATVEEQSVIESAKETVLKNMGYKDLQAVIQKGKYKIYNKKLLEIVSKEIDIDYFYYSYQIKTELKNYEKPPSDIKALRSELNNLIIKNLMNQAKEQQLDTVAKYNVAVGQLKPKNQYNICKCDPDYIVINAKLVSILINEGTPYIGNLDRSNKEIIVSRLDKLSPLNA